MIQAADVGESESVHSTPVGYPHSLQESVSLGRKESKRPLLPIFQ